MNHQKEKLSHVDKKINELSAKINVVICGFAKEQKTKLLRRPQTPELLSDVRKKIKSFEERL
jgi:hypothetical protein